MYTYIYIYIYSMGSVAYVCFFWVRGFMLGVDVHRLVLGCHSTPRRVSPFHRPLVCSCLLPRPDVEAGHYGRA